MSRLLETPAGASAPISAFEAFAGLADYSLMESLAADPEASEDGIDHQAREVFSGHFVPVKPTPLPDPDYVAHSASFFAELGLSDELVHDDAFRRVFSGDLSAAQAPMQTAGWATPMRSSLSLSPRPMPLIRWRLVKLICWLRP